MPDVKIVPNPPAPGVLECLLRDEERNNSNHERNVRPCRRLYRKKVSGVSSCAKRSAPRQYFLMRAFSLHSTWTRSSAIVTRRCWQEELCSGWQTIAVFWIAKTTTTACRWSVVRRRMFSWKCTGRLTVAQHVALVMCKIPANSHTALLCLWTQPFVDGNIEIPKIQEDTERFPALTYPQAAEK